MTPTLKAELEQISGWVIPEHDVLEWLLGKLPHFIEIVQTSGGYTPTGWRVIKRSSQDYWHKGGPIEADAPDLVDAVYKLAIHLFQQNILTKEQV